MLSTFAWARGRGGREGCGEVRAQLARGNAGNAGHGIQPSNGHLAPHGDGSARDAETGRDLAH